MFTVHLQGGKVKVTDEGWGRSLDKIYHIVGEFVQRHNLIFILVDPDTGVLSEVDATDCVFVKEES
jgi:hypothetical protein